jgi:16S rRNA (guanine527-N7)-methyltransferase
MRARPLNREPTPFHVKQPLDPEALRAQLALDDGVMDRLARYLALLRQWQGRINLVGAATLADPWRRHILDSAQLWPLLPPGDPEIVDLGSGAGFPGLVLAILGAGRVMVVDSDQRKCVFLREAARVTGTRVIVRPARIETLAPCSADVITARAFRPLPQLLALGAPVLRPDGCFLLLKGAGVGDELTAAGRQWTMRIDSRPSLSDAAGVVLQLTQVEPR